MTQLEKLLGQQGQLFGWAVALLGMVVGYSRMWSMVSDPAVSAVVEAAALAHRVHHRSHRPNHRRRSLLSLPQPISVSWFG